MSVDLHMLSELEVVRFFPLLGHFWLCFYLTEKGKIEWIWLLDYFNY